VIETVIASVVEHDGDERFEVGQRGFSHWALIFCCDGIHEALHVMGTHQPQSYSGFVAHNDSTEGPSISKPNVVLDIGWLPCNENAFNRAPAGELAWCPLSE
jgi:hypothetical protein